MRSAQSPTHQHIQMQTTQAHRHTHHTHTHTHTDTQTHTHTHTHTHTGTRALTWPKRQQSVPYLCSAPDHAAARNERLGREQKQQHTKTHRSSPKACFEVVQSRQALLHSSNGNHETNQPMLKANSRELALPKTHRGLEGLESSNNKLFLRDNTVLRRLQCYQKRLVPRK
jgi:hypothetical protein